MKNISITNNAKAKIELSLLTNTQLEWSAPNDYELNVSKILKQQIKFDTGIFDCFLLNATFQLSCYTDGIKILFVYQSTITYRNGGTNGFSCRFLFDLEGNLLEIKY
jgi:hypothetical protein